FCPVSVATVVNTPPESVDRPVPCASIQDPWMPVGAGRAIPPPPPPPMQPARMAERPATAPADNTLRAIVMISSLSFPTRQSQSPDFRAKSRRGVRAGLVICARNAVTARLKPPAIFPGISRVERLAPL